MNKKNMIIYLKIIFLAGAVTDALAILPMVFPSVAHTFWGFDKMQGAYFFAMGMGASLMLGWTALLIWGFFRPVERRLVVLFTLVVIAGFVAAEITALQAGVIAFGFVLPSLILQSALSALYLFGFVQACLLAKKENADANT